MVRLAAPDDIPALLEMGKQFHAESRMPFAFDLGVMGEVLARLIASDSAVVLMTDRGVIGGMLNAAYCDPAWVYAVEMFWWARGDGMALLKEFEGWAQRAGAKEVRMTSLASLPRADLLLRRFGYTQAEISYSKVI
jgi:GNAT superfamily N-acetyltransferase